jgi:hypothetical protein
MALSKDQALKIIVAGGLMQFAHAELSDFELEKIAEVNTRWMRHGREAEVTELEWPVIDQAVEAMRAGWKAGRVTVPVAYRIAA